MNSTMILLSILAFVLGVFAKYADLFNDNGLKEPFYGASYLAGLIWGLCGLLINIISPFAGIVYVAHVLYWFERLKLDGTNHAVAGIMIIMSMIFFKSSFLLDHKFDLVVLFLCFSSTGHIHSFVKKKFPQFRIFLRLRLRIYFIGGVYSLVVNDFGPFLTTISGMLGTEIITFVYRNFKENLKESC